MLTNITLISIDLIKEELTLTIAQSANSNPFTCSFKTKNALWYIKAITSDLVSKTPEKPLFYPPYQDKTEQFLSMNSAVQSLRIIEHLEAGRCFELLYRDFSSFFYLFAAAAYDCQQLINKYTIYQEVNKPEFCIPNQEFSDFKKSYLLADEINLAQLSRSKAFKVWGFCYLNKIRQE